MSKNKDSVKSKITITLVIFFIATLFVTLFIAIILDRNGSPTPIISAFGVAGNYLGAVATLAAAYIATLLFNDWREEKEYDIKAIYIRNTINGISKILVNLANLKSISAHLELISSHLIVRSSYINQLTIQHYDDVMVMHSNILNYIILCDEGDENNELIELCKDLQNHLIVLDNLNTKLLKLYQQYFTYYVDGARLSLNIPYNANVDIFRKESFSQINDRIAPHIYNRGLIIDFIKSSHDRVLSHNSDKVEYGDHLSECISKLEALNSACIRRLKLHK